MLKILTFLFCLFFLSHPVYASEKKQVFTSEAGWLSEITNPQEFTAKLFYYILSANNDNDLNRFPKMFFSNSLLEGYLKVVAKDKASQEVGCLNDFNNFTGAQEFPYGIWVGAVRLAKNQTLVPVYFSFGDNLKLNKPNVILHLLKISGKYKIDDIEYLDSSKSLRILIASCLKT